MQALSSLRPSAAHFASLVLRSWPVSVILGTLLALTVIGSASAAGSWLDGALPTWNKAGAAVPPAPPLDPTVQARCRAQERAPSGIAETQVAAAGWRLESYWKSQQHGDETLVMADVNYDGMCRPWGFNGFVFVGSTFVGTISPVNMNSREDSVLRETPTFLPDGRLTANYLRYASTDPLCCPSLPTDQVTYRIDRTGAPVLLVEQISQLPKPAPTHRPTPLPNKLPNTGAPAPAPWLPATGAALLIAAGLVLRRAART